MAAPRLCGPKLMQIFPAGSKGILILLCIFLLKSQDPATEVKTLMKWQIYLHLSLMKLGRCSPFTQSTLSSAEVLVQSCPASWDIFRIHLHVASSAGLLGPLPYLDIDACWALKQEPTLPRAFVSPPFYLLLSELSAYFFGTGLPSCCQPVLPALVHNWLGLLSCSSMSMLKKQTKKSVCPHRKPVCNLSWGKTHIPLMGSSQTDRWTCLRAIMVARMYTQAK